MNYGSCKGTILVDLLYKRVFYRFVTAKTRFNTNNTRIHHFYSFKTMNSQRNKQVTIKSLLNNFLEDMNYNNVYLLPCNNDPRRLTVRARVAVRRGRRFQTLNGMDLMKENIKEEAKRLGLHNSHVAYLVNLATIR